MTTKKPAAKPIPAAKAAVTKPAEKAVVKAIAKAAAPSINMKATAAEVDRIIASIKTRGAKLDHDMHSAAMACLWHADQHGDITLMNRLIMALGKSVRKNALGTWAITFGKFQTNEDKNTRDTSPLVYAKANKTDIDAAMAKPFYDFKNVKEGTVEWQFGNYITGVMKSLAAHAVGTSPDARQAKAAFDALAAINEAAASAAPPAVVLPEGQHERRAAAVH